jgi:hypothetical protein
MVWNAGPPTEQEMDLLRNSPESEYEEIPKPFLSDSRQVKKHLSHWFESPVSGGLNRTLIKHWKKGGAVLRARHPMVRDGEWQSVSIRRLDGPLKRTGEAN